MWSEYMVWFSIGIASDDDILAIVGPYFMILSLLCEVVVRIHYTIPGNFVKIIVEGQFIKNGGLATTNNIRGKRRVYLIKTLGIKLYAL